MSDQEDKDRVIEELRSDKEVLRRGLEDKDRAARLEELRFAKKQQWYIATSALTLLAAIFGIAHVIKPTTLDEKKVGTVFVVLIVWFACEFLRQLQGLSTIRACCWTRRIARHGFAAWIFSQC
jgi:hypothetical protein